MLRASRDGKVEVLTSTLSIAECTHAGGNYSEDVRNLFRKVLTSGQYVILIQDTILVAERARDLRWVHNVSFKGADSIHIASALDQNCGEFVTFDGKMHDRALELQG